MTEDEASLKEGFDLPRTRDNLYAVLLHSGGLAKASVAPPPSAELSEGAGPDALWRRAHSGATFFLAMCAQHAERCAECARASQDGRPSHISLGSAIALALLEMCNYWLGRAWRELAISLAKASEYLAALDPNVLVAIEKAASSENASEATTRPTDDIRLIAEVLLGATKDSAVADAALKMMEDVSRFRRETLENAQLFVRECRALSDFGKSLVQMTSSQETVRSGRGPRRKGLLSAVQQQLKRGGLTRGQISELIAGIGGDAVSTSPEARKRQVHQRTRREDMRTLRPFEGLVAEDASRRSPKGHAVRRGGT